MQGSNQSILKAKKNLSAMFLMLLVLDSILVFLSRDLWAIGRILLTAVIMYFVLQGYRWAKWMLVGILSLVVIALVGLLAVLGQQLSLIISVGSVVMAVLCCVVMAYLIGNHELQQYFASKRQSATR